MSEDFSENIRFQLDETDVDIAGDTIFGTRHRVLHIDGDEDAALVLATLLVPDVHVTHAMTLVEAAELIAAEEFSLVVLDPDLPDGDGTPLIDAIRLMRAGTPLLLYSARQVRHGAQANAFLPKPWTSPRQLWRSVSELLTLASATSSGPLS